MLRNILLSKGSPGRALSCIVPVTDIFVVSRSSRLLNSGYTVEELNDHMDQLALEEYEYYKSKSLKSKIAKIPKLVGKSTGRSIRWMLYG